MTGAWFDVYGTKIYGATLLPPSWQLKSSFGSKLMKYYKEKYEELKDLFDTDI